MSVFVVVTEAACEKRAMLWLLEHGLPAYTPIKRSWRRLCGTRVRSDQAVFARYVFVSSDDIDADFHLVRRCRYVSGILGRDGKPKPIDDVSTVARFLVFQAFGMLDYTRSLKPKYSVGQLVRIIGGQFAALGYSGQVSEVRDGRLIVIPKTGGKLNVAMDQVVDAAAAPTSKAA
jgi:transcription antitermination factor NusG